MFDDWDLEDDDDELLSSDDFEDDSEYDESGSDIFLDFQSPMESYKMYRMRCERPLAGLISMMPDAQSPGPLDAGSSSRYSLDDTVMDIDPPLDSEGKGEWKQVRKLLDICSRVVARTCTCEELERAEPPLDESMLKGIAQWAFPQDEKQVRAYSNLTDKCNYWERGVNMFKENRIKEMWQVGFMASALLTRFPVPRVTTSKTQQSDDSCEIRVSLTFEQQRIISSTCSECRSEIWCPHVLAAIIYRIRRPNQVVVHAPMTEALSTLDRDQLQKLVQYAVQEDPAGILGRVFKNLNDIRDTNSEINVTPGAPDPTFGRPQGCKTQWQLSVEALEKNLKTDLKEMSSHSYYPNNFDLMEKKESRMFKYIKKVVDLHKKNEDKAAANVLTRIANCVIQKMEVMLGTNECPELCRFCHDLARFSTLYMLTAKPHMRNFLYKSAFELQRRSFSVARHALGNSCFTELPSTVPLLKDRLDEGVRHGLFTEVLCAYEAGPATQQLCDLINGKVAPEDSTYEEDLPIMMARLEAINWLEVGAVANKMGRLAIRIVYKLLHAIQGDSVIGAYLEAVGESTPQAQALMNILKTGNVKQIPPPPASIKGKGGKRRGKSAKKMKKHNENTELPSNLNKNQLTYCLLYLCHSMIQWQRKSVTKTNHERQVVGYCLLALEMSRHRTATPSDQIQSSENNWLLRMEMSICDFLESQACYATAAVSLYMDAFTTVGISFYNGCYPLVLIDILLCLYIKNDKLRERVDDVVALCAAFLQDSHNPLEKFTLPSSTPFDLILDTLSNGDRSFRYERYHKDFAQKKFHAITETFFSQIDTSKKSHVQLAHKVLQQFETYDNYNLLRRVTRELRFHIAKLDDQSNLLEGALRVLLHSLKCGEKTYLMVRNTHRREDLEFIFSLVRKLGIPSLRLFISRWQNFFDCRNLKELLIFLKPQVAYCKTVPREVTQLVMQYYSAEIEHEDGACELLSFFKPHDANFKQASQKIVENAVNFTVNSLFELAKLELSNGSVTSTGRRVSKVVEDGMTEDAFQIVEKALVNLRAPGQANVTVATYDHLDWLCTRCSQGPTKEVTARHSYLSRVVALLREHCGHHPSLLLHVLQLLERSPGLARVGVGLGEALIAAYGQHFVERFHECSHSAYGSVISEMRCAQLHSKQYVRGGDVLFEGRVVAKVRETHSGKKKLLRMLDVEFGQKASGAAGLTQSPSSLSTTPYSAAAAGAR